MIITLLTRICRGKTWAGLVIVIMVCYCSASSGKKEAVRYETYWASCLKAPGIGELPREIGANDILPEMGARMETRQGGYSAYEGLTMDEQYKIIQSWVYPSHPLIKTEDWQQLKENTPKERVR